MHLGINAHLLAFSGNYRQAGLSRYIFELTARLPRVLPGDRVTALVGTLPPDGAFPDLPNLHFAPSPLPTGRAPVRIAWEQIALPIVARRLGLDLIFLPVNVRPFTSPCPTVVTIHDLVFLLYPQAFHPLKRRYLTAMTRWSARHASRVLTVSEATRRDVINLLRVPPHRVTTIHNGVGDNFRPASSEEKEAFRRAHNLHGRVIVNVGTIEPRKNLSMLLRAFSHLLARPGFEDVTLVIGGSKGWYYEEVFDTARRLGFGDGESGGTGERAGRVRWLGRVSDEELPLWYNVADACAYPSLYEGFGLPALEAMACGTPVICSNTSALPEVVGEAGILLDPQDVSAWAQAIARVLAEPELAGAMRAKGMERAARFGWEQTARRTAQALSDTYSRTRPRRK